MPISVKQLRHYTIARSLFPQTTLKEAIDQLGFVQADPIKAPAAAQDLILRQRVLDYRNGDLDREYENLAIEEDVLYAYGFVANKIWRYLRPRKIAKLAAYQKKVLQAVLSSGQIHPRDLEKLFGSDRVVNAWGGYSKASTDALDSLHSHGLIRVARREKGIRVYTSALEHSELLSADLRARELVRSVVHILAPISLRSLRETISRLRFLTPTLGEIKPAMDALLRSGELRCEVVEGVEYIFPDEQVQEIDESEKQVKILSPFDPVVWDRRRFEHLWNWVYRFEAYTPVAKRIRGYYAMPLLWGDDVIGWANASTSGKKLDVDFGFVSARPRDKQFKKQLELELARFEGFLQAKSIE